jgi:hypothetical protein
MTTELLTMPAEATAVEEVEASPELAGAAARNSSEEAERRSRPRLSLGGWTWPIAPPARK